MHRVGELLSAALSGPELLTLRYHPRVEVSPVSSLLYDDAYLKERT